MKFELTTFTSVHLSHGSHGKLRLEAHCSQVRKVEEMPTFDGMFKRGENKL